MTAIKNVADFLLDCKDPDRLAIRTLETDFTYGELQAACAEFAACLSGAGCRGGDRVILLSGNSFHWAAAYLGILHGGMICVPLSPSISAEELRYVIENTEARFAFLQTQLRPRHSATLAAASVTAYHEAARWQTGYFQRGPAIATQRLEAPAPQEDLSHLAALMFTSGSTGLPRAVMVSHENIVANTTSIVASVGLQEDDRMMVVLPFHYCFGTSLLHTYLKAAGTLVIDTRFTYPEVVLDRMELTECTSFAGVPSHYQILLRNSSLARRHLPALRSFLQAGGHLAPSFLEQLQRAEPHARIFVMYGQTEATARLACLPPEFLTAKSGSVGKAIPGVTLRVMDESGAEARQGEIGEIVAEGANVTCGYWRAPEETAQSFRNGKLYTGDLAKTDEEGFIYIVDRAREFIKCGGTRISCRQLEDRLLDCEELSEAAVIGMPDDILGEAVRAFVVPREAHSEGLAERMRDFCKAAFPHSLVPKEIVVLKALPRNSSGKVLRAQLKMSPIDAQFTPTANAPATR